MLNHASRLAAFAALGQRLASLTAEVAALRAVAEAAQTVWDNCDIRASENSEMASRFRQLRDGLSALEEK